MTTDVKHEAVIPPRARRLPTTEDFARAKAMYAAGQGVAHVVVGQWRLTWGKPDRKDFDEWLKDQDG